MRAARFIGPGAIAFLAIWVLLLLAGRSSFFRDPGTFWHTSTGELILSEGWIRSDPYTFTHFTHGALFYGVTRALMPSAALGLRALIAIGLEGAWEAYENTDTVIERYRGHVAANAQRLAGA